MPYNPTDTGAPHRGKRMREPAQPSIRKQTFNLYPKQYEFVQDAHPNIGFIAGRGAGKTYSGIVKDFIYAMEHPGSRILVCAPCYDDKTEILTEKRGWQLFCDLTPFDRVATLRDGHFLEYQLPVNWHDYSYEGTMIYLENQELDLAVTPNHRCWVRFKQGRWHFMNAGTIYGKWDWHFKKTIQIDENEVSPAEKYFEFLGFWFAEGYAQYDPEKRRRRVVITQKWYKDYALDLVASLHMPFNTSTRDDGVMSIEVSSAELSQQLAQYGRSVDRVVPLWIKESSVPCLRAFLRGFIKGDGHQKTWEHDKTEMWTHSHQLADDLQEIAFKAGYAANVSAQRSNGQYHVCIRTAKKNNPKTTADHWWNKQYAGRVYCVEVPNGIVYVRRNGKACWCGNSYTLLRDNARQTFLDICPRDYIIRYSMKENSVALRNGSLIYFRSLDQPDLLRGYTVAAVHIDEAGSVSKEASDIVRACLRQSGYPLQRWLTTTPKGKNWIWAEFERDTDAEHILYRARSSDNPHLPKNFEGSLGYSGLFYKQEILGLFETFEGLVYPTFSRDLLVGIPNRNDFGRIVAGVDFGYTDPAAIEVVGQSKDRQRLTVCDEYYVKSVTIDDHIKAAKELKERWGIVMFVCDPSRPDSIEMFRRAGLPVTKGHNDILGGVTKVASYLPADPEKPEESRLTVSIACKNLVAEFEQYGFATSVDGEVIKEKPLDVYNHAEDCLRYACMYLAQSGRRDIWF